MSTACFGFCPMVKEIGCPWLLGQHTSQVISCSHHDWGLDIDAGGFQALSLQCLGLSGHLDPDHTHLVCGKVEMLSRGISYQAWHLTEPLLNLSCPLWSVTTVHHFVFIPPASPSGQEHHPLPQSSTTKQQRPWFLKINIFVIKYWTSCLKSCRNNSRLCMLLSSPRDDSALLLTNDRSST